LDVALGSGLVTAVIVVALDQWTKQIAVSELEYRVPVMVTSWFDWMLTYNTGAAFSFLADAGGWQRWFLTGIAVACQRLYYLVAVSAQPRRSRVGLTPRADSGWRHGQPD
jgi:signal peptidase II